MSAATAQTSTAVSSARRPTRIDRASGLCHRRSTGTHRASLFSRRCSQRRQRLVPIVWGHHPASSAQRTLAVLKTQSRKLPPHLRGTFRAEQDPVSSVRVASPFAPVTSLHRRANHTAYAFINGRFCRRRCMLSDSGRCQHHSITRFP